MDKLRALAVCALAGLLAGCSAVYSAKPLGDAPAVIDAADWEGTWIHRDAAYTIAVTAAEKGLLRAAWIENLEPKSCEIQLRTSGDWMIGSTQDKEDEDGRFVWGRVKRDGGQCILWVPSVPKFKALVEQGVLPGTVADGGNVMLGELTTNHLGLIASETRGVLFDWDEPVVFTRLAE